MYERTKRITNMHTYTYSGIALLSDKWRRLRLIIFYICMRQSSRGTSIGQNWMLTHVNGKWILSLVLKFIDSFLGLRLITKEQLARKKTEQMKLWLRHLYLKDLLKRNWLFSDFYMKLPLIPLCPLPKRTIKFDTQDKAKQGKPLSTIIRFQWTSWIWSRCEWRTLSTWENMYMLTYTLLLLLHGTRVYVLSRTGFTWTCVSICSLCVFASFVGVYFGLFDSVRAFTWLLSVDKNSCFMISAL